jgi:hypothetical protein
VLAIVNTFEVPLTAWRVHSAAWESYTRDKQVKMAEQHRDRAESLILAMAESLGPHQSLRDIFLKASPVREILDGAHSLRAASAH